MRFPASPVKRNRSAPQAGFSLMEVMVAMGILSGMVIALSTAWVSLSKSSFDLLLKQKAVFVLNGEMERLAALYQFSDLGHHNAIESTGYPELPGISDTRRVYEDDMKHYMPTNDDDFMEENLEDFNSGSDGLALYVGSGSSPRVYVWLDRPRSLLARMSWTESEIVPDTCTFAICECYDHHDRDGDTDPCRALTLVLDYPFHFNAASGVEENQTPKSMTLQTIIGRRR